MNASLRWLRDFVAFDLSPAELRELLTARCATVDELVQLRQDLADIVIGRVVEAGPHPGAERLWVTKVDAGTGALYDVVCGAPNVSVGTLYPFASVGASLPGGVRIEKRKIRGAVSEGMLCSARELGLGSDHTGILALDVAAEPGARFLDVMPVGDLRLVIDVLPNRPDLLSHEGLAREISAATGLPMARPQHPPATLLRASDSPPPASIEVVVEDSEGAPRYMTAIVRGVTVGPSPEWLASRLEAAGVRSISNVVDVTNYMLHGFGQPMHAFDVAHIGGSRIVVRRARDGEKLVTLDGVERTLDSGMTVIADAEKAQAIAGVIGGKGSEVSESTTDILLEVAAFDPARIRSTRRRLGISTDASYRFERGVDQGAIPELLHYAVELIARVAGGTRHGDPTDAHVAEQPREPIAVRNDRIALVLGEELDRAETTRNLESVGFGVTGTGKDFLVSPPGFRRDVTGEVEVIEEIARLRGYELFSSGIRPFRPGTVPDAPLHVAASRVRAECIALGLLEARPMPFVRHGSAALRVRNPLAEDEAFLRTSILETLARRVEYNFARTQRQVRLFETGEVFLADASADTGAPLERTHVGVVVAGHRMPPHFTEPHPPDYDQWDARGIAERVAGAAFPGARITCEPSDGAALWTVLAEGTPVGSVVRLDVDAPVWAPACYGVEIDLEAAPPGLPAAVGYRAIPAFPAMEVDLALLVPAEVSARTVDEAIRVSAGDLLERLDVFDEFRGPGIPDGTRSIAWRLTFRHPERTLREREVQGRTAKILSVLESKLGIRQRTA